MAAADVSLALASAYQIALKAKAEPPAGWPMPAISTSARHLLAMAATRNPADGLPVVWTRWDNVKAIAGRRSVGTWAELVAFLAAMSGEVAASKSACSGWAPCAFDDDRRADAGTRAIYALTLDCDDRGDWGTTIAVMRDLSLAFCAHRSPTHGIAGAVKWRLIVPLSVPVTQVDRWREMYSAARTVFGALGGAWYDPTCSNPSRLWYPPITVGDQDRREVISGDGTTLDIVRLAELVAGVAAPVAQQPAVLPPLTRGRLSVVTSARDRAERWLDKVEGAVEGQGGDDATFRVAAKLVRDFGLSDSEALALMLRWDSRCSPSWGSAALEVKIAHARKYGKHAEGAALDEPYRPDSPGATAEADAPAPKPRGVPWVRVHPESSPHAGKPISCVENLEALLAYHGVSARFCLMSHRASIEIAGQVVAAERRNNAARAQIREWARAAQYQTGAAFEDQLELVISKQCGHPVADWIRSKPWDGGDRFPALLASLSLTESFGARFADLALRILEAWLVTGARAALLPAGAREGIAAQGVLVLQGAQGCGKSRWVESLVAGFRAWVKIGCTIDPGNRDSLQAATKTWITEIGELDGTFRKSDIAALKAFLTSPTDTYRKAYDASDEDVARRTVFAATVNDPIFLSDSTGSRRFWGLSVESCNAEHGLDMQQVWAQAAYIGERTPYRGWLTDDEAAELRIANSAHEVRDPMYDALTQTWAVGDGWVRLDEIKAAIDVMRTWSWHDTRHLSSLVRGRLGAKMRVLGGSAQYGVVRR